MQHCWSIQHPTQEHFKRYFAISILLRLWGLCILCEYVVNIGSQYVLTTIVWLHGEQQYASEYIWDFRKSHLSRAGSGLFLRLFTRGESFDPKVVPDPATHLVSESLWRYEVVLAMHSTWFTKIRIMQSLQYVCSVICLTTTSPIRISVYTNPLVSNVLFNTYYVSHRPRCWPSLCHEASPVRFNERIVCAEVTRIRVVQPIYPQQWKPTSY